MSAFTTTQELDTFLRERHAVRSGGAGATFERVCTDSRQVGEGDLFVALKGESFDGHAYVETAKNAGARGAVVASDWAKGQDRAALVDASPKRHGAAVLQSDFALWMVDDTLLALGDIARGHLRRVGAARAALTGSNGKTTTKEFCAAILKAHFGDTLVHYTQGNLNNQVGVPLTAFNVTGEHRVALFEMGMNHTGEIAALCRIVEPQAALITNVGPAHIGNFDGMIEGVANAKGEIFAGIASGGKIVVNLDDPPVVEQARKQPESSWVMFGRDPNAHVRLTDENDASSGGEAAQTFAIVANGATMRVTLHVPGSHNALNACAAAALALTFGVSNDAVVRGLESARTSSGRLTSKKAMSGALVLDDSYNANPASMKASIEVARRLADAQGRRLVLILGDMLELGATELDLHRLTGAAAAAMKPALLFSSGVRSKALVEGAIAAGLPVASVMHSDSLEALLPGIEREIKEGDVVLVKGSRGARMERAVAALCGTTSGPGH